MRKIIIILLILAGIATAVFIYWNATRPIKNPDITPTYDNTPSEQKPYIPPDNKPNSKM